MNKTDFRYIYDKYVDLVYYVANSMVHDYYLSQDICQEVFIKLYRHIDYLDKERVKGWLLVVTETTAIDFLRKHSCLKEFYGEDSKSLCKAEASDMEDILKELEIKELGCQMLRALYEKSADWYEIVVGIDVAEISAKELAQKMNISVSNLRVKHHRARKWLKKKFNCSYQELL